MTRARSAEVSVEVAGTPEEAWDAIATGPGITAWFVPAEVEEREGGAVSLDVGTGMAPAGTVTGWDPPRRFAYEETWPALDDEPAGRLATEFHVEARAGGTCVVRIVSSVFASGEAWDRELDNLNEGWRSYLRNLALYMSRHRGQRCATILVTGVTGGSPADGWAALTSALGLADAREGERTGATASGAPALAGVVERESAGPHHRDLLLRLDRPAVGSAFVYVYGHGDRAHVNVHAYLFGEDAEEIAARDRPRWEAWMRESFGVPAPAG
jgi:uncharacterized protein YndB with AHSA1/START domain